MRKIFPYLILNIIVSAVTVMVVLAIWQKAQQASLEREFSRTTATLEPVRSQSTLPPLSIDTIEIQTIVGIGDLENERVQLVSVAKEVVDLSGWGISGGKGQVYRFPAVKLYPGGSINLFSKSGVDTSIALYWNQPTAVWMSGDKVKLIDPDGNTRSEYRIP